jgi:putative PIN family toxin of toxin-antitoxin system
VTQIRRVVFDTSTLVSAALRAGSVPYRALMQALAACHLCASAETLAELERVLARKKFDPYMDLKSRLDFVALIRRNVDLIEVPIADGIVIEPPCRDSAASPFLALALVAEADVIVSSDEDLLVLHPWNGISILRPADFVAES